MANRRFIDFPIAASVGNNDIVLIWQDGLNKQTTKATLLQGSPQSLAGLTDVDIAGLINGQILQYNSTTSKWENVDRTDINLSQLGDVTIVAPANGQVLVYNSSTGKWENSSAGYVPYTGAVTTVNLGAQSILAGSFVKAGGTSAQFLKANGSVDSTAYGTGTVTSVALTMPSAFSVGGSPITTAGTLAVTGAGTVGQYIRGDGSLADFPATTGGGSSVSYYLNGSVSQGTIGGVAYKELNRTPIFGAGTDISTSSNGYIANFITDAGDPNKLLIPAGNWNLETYFSANNGGGSPTFYVELYKYNGTTFTLIASSSGTPELIAFGTNINPYFTTLAVPETVLALTDRLALRYYVNTSGRTITLHTENGHLCQIITTFTTGLTALNGLTSQVQFFAVGTSGTDFAISSATDTHTFNLPTASATNRGALSSADWTTFNNKTSNLGTVTSVGLSSATSGVTIGSTPITTSGTITLAIATASGSQNGLLSSTDWTTFNNKAPSVAGGYLPLSGGTLTGPLGGTSIILSGDITANRYRGVNSLVLNTYTTVNPASNVYLYSPGNDRDAWIYLDSADTGSNWGIYHRQIDSAVSGLPGNSIGFIGGGTNTLQAWISLISGDGFFAGSLTASNLSGTNTGNVTIGTANGLSLSGQALSLGLASGSANGALSSTDWTTFNAKQNALTNPVTGTGTTNYLPKFTGSTTIGNSNLINDASGNVGLGITPSAWFNDFRPIQIGAAGGTSIASDDWNGFTEVLNNVYGSARNTYTRIQSLGASRYSQQFGNHIWYSVGAGSGGTSVSFTPVMTLTNANLLVGTSTDAGFKLDVNGTGRFVNGVNMATTSGNVGIGTTTPNNFLALEKSSNSGSGSAFPRIKVMNTLATQGDGSSTFNFADINISSGNEAVNMFLATTFAAGTWAPAGIINVSTNHDLQFKTNNTERMRITSGGDISLNGGSSSTQTSTATPNNIRFNNNYSNGFTDSSLKIYLFNSGSTRQGFTSGPAYDLQYHSSGDASGKHVFYVANNPIMTVNNLNVLVGTQTDSGDKLRVNGTTFSNEIMTLLPEAESRSGIVWRFGAASIATIIPNRRLRVKVGGVEYYIGAVEV